MLANFKSLADFNKAFPDEDACINHFRAVRWADVSQIACPHCGTIGKPYLLGNNTHKCSQKGCMKKFSVRNGSIFEDSKIPLQKWFMAIFLMTSHKKGISSCQLAKDIGVTQKSAWFMLHRVRNATMTREFQTPLTGVIEADEAYVGPNAKWQHKSKKNPLLVGMAAAKTKKAVLGMVQRDGELRLHSVQDGRKATTEPIIRASVAAGAEIHTDESPSYAWMRSAYAHKMVTHSIGEYVRGDVTTNRIEGAFSHFKRTIVGTYHKASDTHLDRYLQMFAFRWNSRTMSESERMNLLLARTQGRRITYRTLIGKDAIQ
jgi:transposase-like protein